MVSNKKKKIMAQTIKRKYENFFQPIMQNLASYSITWKILQWCKETLLRGCCRIISNGTTTRAWLDPCIYGNINFKLVLKIGINSLNS